jgi:hypothetical protein
MNKEHNSGKMCFMANNFAGDKGSGVIIIFCKVMAEF